MLIPGSLESHEKAATWKRVTFVLWFFRFVKQNYPAALSRQTLCLWRIVAARCPTRRRRGKICRGISSSQDIIWVADFSLYLRIP